MTGHQPRPEDWQMHVLIWDEIYVHVQLHVHTHTKTDSEEHPWAVSVQCKALISFYVTVCFSPHAKCPRDSLCREGLTSCVPAGILLGAARTKRLLVLMWKIALSLGECWVVPKKCYRHKKLHHLFEDMLWAFLCSSFHVVKEWEHGLHGPQISGLSSLEPLMHPNVKPGTTRPFWEHLDFWSVSCHESYWSNEMYEGWLCYFV